MTCNPSPTAYAPSPERQGPQTTDILAIGPNPTLAVYLSGLFQRFRWSVYHVPDLASALKFLSGNRTAVAICEADLPDGAWHEVASRVHSILNPPTLIVITDDARLLDEVASAGGFDIVTRPLREADVVWTVASAWDCWMKRVGDRHGGGMPCSDA